MIDDGNTDEANTSHAHVQLTLYFTSPKSARVARVCFKDIELLAELPKPLGNFIDIACILSLISGGYQIVMESCTLGFWLVIILSYRHFQPGSQRSHFGLSGKVNPSSIFSDRISSSSLSSTYRQGTPGNVSEITRSWLSSSYEQVIDLQ